MALAARPKWFEWALSVPYEDHIVSCGKTNIHYQLWRSRSGACDAQAIVLVHGGGAHSHWWDWIAPFLADGCTVAALDSSGHGESDAREAYSMDLHAEEILAVCHDLKNAGCRPKPWLVGHSFGGWICLIAAKEYGEQLGGVVVLDSAVPPPTNKMMQPPPRVTSKPGESTKEGMLARFRLMPPQAVEHKFLLEYIAPLSIRVKDGLYVWNHDPTRMEKMLFAPADQRHILMSERLRGLRCRLAVLYGSDSGLHGDHEVIEYMKAEVAEHRPGGHAFTPVVALPCAQHHVMFDQPLALVTALRSFFAEWQRQDMFHATGPPNARL